MIVSVKNAKDRNLTKLLKLASYSFAKNLMRRRLIDNIVISITLHKNLSANGFCYSEDDYKKRNFSIDILKFKREMSMLKILAHEMVHVKQYATNQLKEKKVNNKVVTTWMGKIYDDTFYWDQPWEIEAYGIENGLLAKFLIEHQLFAQLKENKKHWVIDK